MLLRHAWLTPRQVEKDPTGNRPWKWWKSKILDASSQEGKTLENVCSAKGRNWESERKNIWKVEARAGGERQGIWWASLALRWTESRIVGEKSSWCGQIGDWKASLAKRCNEIGRTWIKSNSPSSYGWRT